MSEDLHCECGVAVLYWLAQAPGGRPDRNTGPLDVTPMMLGLLLDPQNRG